MLYDNYSKRQKMVLSAIKEIEAFEELFDKTYITHDTGTRLAKIWIMEALGDKQSELLEEIEMMFLEVLDENT